MHFCLFDLWLKHIACDNNIIYFVKYYKGVFRTLSNVYVIQLGLQAVWDHSSATRYCFTYYSTIIFRRLITPLFKFHVSVFQVKFQAISLWAHTWAFFPFIVEHLWNYKRTKDTKVTKINVSSVFQFKGKIY